MSDKTEQPDTDSTGELRVSKKTKPGCKPKMIKMPPLKVAEFRRGMALDSATAPTREQAEAAYAAGFRTWFRYLDRVPQDPDHDDRLPINLTRPELAMLLDVGFDVGLVQYYSTAYESQERGARISGAYGTQLGAIASANARALGIPRGVTIFADAEDWIRLRSKLHGRQYLVAFFEAVVAGGDEPGLYYGPNLGNGQVGYLNGREIWGLPAVRAYWKPASAAPHLPRRGPTVVQTTTFELAGLPVDGNTLTLDGNYTSERYRFKVIRKA